MGVLSLIFSIILFSFGLFLSWGKSNITRFIIYLILWVAFGPLIYHLLIGIEEPEQYYNIIQWAKYSAWMVMLMNLHNLLAEKKTLIFLIGIAFCYFLIVGLTRNGNFISGMKFNFGCYLDVLVLLTILRKKIDVKKIQKAIKLLLYMEILVGIFQILFSIRFYPATSDVVGTELTGTFIGANIYAEFLSLITFFVVYVNSISKKYISLKDFLLLFFVTVIVLYSGVRMALISHVLILLLLTVIIYSHNSFVKRNSKRIIMGICLVCLFLGTLASNYVLNSEVTFDNQVESSLERQNVLTSIFLRDDYLTEHTTFGLSLLVLSYFELNPLFGPGLFYSSPRGYGGLVNEASQNYTDCTLALYICEVGILGMILFVLLYYYVLKKICYFSIGTNMAFLYMLMVTITDSGIFFFGNYLVFILFAIYARSSKKSVGI